MSKCIFCKKEIEYGKYDWEWYGLDGDYIHINCKDLMEKEINKINNMSDKEFEEYIVN